MTSFPSKARVVIIGGGAVGVSALYHLAKRGWTDCVLLEKNELTSGSTWHAAGNIPTFSSSWAIMAMQRYSTALYRGMGDAVGYPINYSVTGALRLAHTDDRMREFERVRAMSRHQGGAMEMLAPSDIQRFHPLCEAHDLAGGLWDPEDGDIDPAQLTQALAKGARDLGATIIRFCPVTGVRRVGSDWIVATPQGEIACTYVVNAAGYRAREIGALFGRDVPVMTMAHQYVLFSEMPDVMAWTKANGRKLPLVRDVDTSYYLRQEKGGLLVGPYERAGRAHWATPDDPMPADFSFQLYPDDLERIEPYLADAMARVPLLGEVGISKVINGPIPYAPDGNPLIGPMPGVPNAFEACAFTFGICQAGGAGRALSEWVIDGHPTWELWACDPRRFTGYADQSFAHVKGLEVYNNEYAIQYPKKIWPDGRNKRLSPVHDRLAAQGAVFAPYGGWERAAWFAHPGDETSVAATETYRRDGPWEKRVREECLAVRDAAGILDLSGFTKYRLSGVGARAWLQTLTPSRIPSVGRVGLAYFTYDDGKIVTEMSVVAFGADEFWLITAAAAQWHDFAWLKQHLPSSLSLADETEASTCHLLTGPNARAILAACATADLTKPWLTHQRATIAGKTCLLIRVSFAGELGWEVHTPVADAPAVFDALWMAGKLLGLKPFGMYALDSLRLEKGYLSWKGDITSEYSLLEAGRERFIDAKNAKSKGFSAIDAEKRAGSKARLVTLTLDAPAPYDAPGSSTVWHGDTRVGETTSSGYGYRVDKAIVLAMVRIDLAAPGTKLDIEIFGARYAATVQPDAALYDPTNARIRA